MTIAVRSVMGRILEQVRSSPGAALQQRTHERGRERTDYLWSTSPRPLEAFATPLHFWAQALLVLLASADPDALAADAFDRLSGHALCDPFPGREVAARLTKLGGVPDEVPLPEVAEPGNAYRMLDHDVIESGVAEFRIRESGGGYLAWFRSDREWLRKAACMRSTQSL